MALLGNGTHYNVCLFLSFAWPSSPNKLTDAKNNSTTNRNASFVAEINVWERFYTEKFTFFANGTTEYDCRTCNFAETNIFPLPCSLNFPKTGGISASGFSVLINCSQRPNYLAAEIVVDFFIIRSRKYLLKLFSGASKQSKKSIWK